MKETQLFVFYFTCFEPFTISFIIHLLLPEPGRPESDYGSGSMLDNLDSLSHFHKRLASRLLRLQLAVISASLVQYSTPLYLLICKSNLPVYSGSSNHRKLQTRRRNLDIDVHGEQNRSFYFIACPLQQQFEQAYIVMYFTK